MTQVDVLIVGAGPAGLTAATYLSRFRRSVLVADGGEPRAAWIPVSHNMPGFPDGIGGDAILKRMRLQAEEYGAHVQPAFVEALERNGDGFIARLGDERIRARAVLLAAGVVDHHPDLPGIENAIARALVRICPICDGYEAIGKSIAVIGDSDLGAREAAFVRTYSDKVCLIHVGPPETLTRRDDLKRLGLPVIETTIEQVHIKGDRLTALTWGGRQTSFDAVYSALGTTSHCGLAVDMGAALGEDGRLMVDDHQETSVPGLYAAGDVVRGLNQLAVASAEAAVAATAIHNRFRRAEGMTAD